MINVILSAGRTIVGSGILALAIGCTATSPANEAPSKSVDAAMLATEMETFTRSFRERDTEAFLGLLSRTEELRHTTTIEQPFHSDLYGYPTLEHEFKERIGVYEHLFGCEDGPCFREHVLGAGAEAWVQRDPQTFAHPDPGLRALVFVRWMKNADGRWVVAEIAEPAA